MSRGVLKEGWAEKPVWHGVGIRGLPGHGLTFWPLDTGVLVVTEEEAFTAVALIAAHHVDTALLTATVAFSALIYICATQVDWWGCGSSTRD